VTALLCALFFLSGVAALLFETLWFRQAGLAFGNGVWASSLVLSSFMAGLALGNGLAARFGGGMRRPLRLYAVLELAIAVAGVALVFRLQALSPLLVPLLQPWLDVPWLLNPLRLGLAFVLLLVPATAMGATLPVMVGALRARDPSFGGALGRLYGWNTLGAVVGALTGELVAIEHLGLYGSSFLAGGCNLLAALGALAVAERFPAAAALEPSPARARTDAAGRRLLAATFGAGGLLLALEVVWFRFLHLTVHSGSAAFAWMLAVVLAGIALGGMAGGRWLRHRAEAWRQAPAVALAAGIATVVGYAGFHLSTRPVAGLAQSSPLAIAWMAAVLTLPVAALSGVLFPLLGAALARHVAPETRVAGLLTLANTLGCALGSLLGGFVLLPVLGMEYAFFGVALAYAGVAWAARGERRGALRGAGWRSRRPVSPRRCCCSRSAAWTASICARRSPAGTRATTPACSRCARGAPRPRPWWSAGSTANASPPSS
jgi:spermidine synthase